MQPTEEQIRAATLARIQEAQRAIQEAQNHLGRACSALSSLQHAAPLHKQVSKEYDRVHALWYKVEGLLFKKGVRLDALSIESLRKWMEEKAIPSANVS